jgi:hypothetical protein
VKLSDRDLVGIIEQHRSDSLGAEAGDLSNQRATAMDHYHGRPYGNEMDGRSQVVSRDLSEAVDWALPALVRAFVQSGNLGEFIPVGPEDEQLAQQESDYVNQVLMKDNAGFMILHDLAKDAMLLKNCYVKHFWDEKETVSEEEYTGLSIEQVQKLLTDLQEYGSEIEIKGQDVKLVEIDGVPVETFDIRLQIKKKCGKLVCMAVPPEEVRVSKRCRGSLQDSPFTEHVTRKTRSELIEMGMSREFVDSLPAFEERRQDQQNYARDSVTDESDSSGNQGDRSMDEIEFCEAYVRVDYDDDGIAELRKVVTVADRIPPGKEWNEQIPAVPMSGGVIKRVPHRHVGESLDDELADLQEIKTTLFRQLFDNIYATNNQRTVVNENINLRDLTVSTPGGVIRAKGTNPVGGDLMPLVVTPIIDKILPVVDYVDKVKETRTGIRPGSDMDPDILKETTKGAFLEHLNRASQKIEMITRLFAETIVKEWVLQAHSILIRHQDRARMVQLRGKWVPVNPQEWKERTDLTVRVGLGTGNEEEKRQKLMMLAQLQVQLLQAATMAPPQIYAKGYALFEDVANAMGFETAEKYGLAPNGEEYQALSAQMQQKAGQPPPEVQMKQAEIASQQQLEQMRMQMQQQTDANRQSMEAQQQQVKMQMEMELERAKAEMQMQLEREKANIQAQVQLEIARINAESRLDAAQLTAKATLSAQQESASDKAVGGAA